MLLHVSSGTCTGGDVGVGWGVSHLSQSEKAFTGNYEVSGEDKQFLFVFVAVGLIP